MDRLIGYARARGTGEIFGYVLTDNHRMLDMCARMGFSRAALPDDPGVLRVSLDLTAGGATDQSAASVQPGGAPVSKG